MKIEDHTRDRRESEAKLRAEINGLGMEIEAWKACATKAANQVRLLNERILEIENQSIIARMAIIARRRLWWR